MTIRVLIADDQAEIREALVALLEPDPAFEVVAVAGDGDEAIELARIHHPDVALLDYKMPAGGGPRATREITAAGIGTRIVALSAYEDSAAVLEMVRAGAVAYVIKGASGGEICETILRSARGEGTLSPEITADVVSELRDRLRTQAAAEDEERARLGRVRGALAEGAMKMHFQPIVDLRARRPIGFEALARFFIEPRRSPNVWFLEAAAAGLEVELELAAVEAALRQLDSVPEGMFVSVNVSPGVLLSAELRDAISTVRPARLVLETTEHAAVEEYRALHDALTWFRSQGGRLAVDDAGAGYASLRHILQLEPDFIKLDASLTRGIDIDRSRVSLASALISFAREIGATIVAEGIETAAELAALVRLGVQYGQGYHVARPAPVEYALAAVPAG